MERQVYEFIFTQTGEKILTRKTCPDCGQEFAITDKDLEFYSKISPVFNGTKYEIPAPTLCPDCRQQRRLARRNERKLYKRKCDLSGKDMISVYSRDSDYKVYDQKEWRSDKRNPLDYGRDFDFTKTFWKQIDELIKDVPCIGLYSGLEMENCHYCNYGNQCKNSYLSINCYLQENALYCKGCSSSEGLGYNNVDCTENNDDCVEVYQSQKLKHCTKVFFSYNSDFCENCRYCYDCTNCKNCVGCTNLKNKQYYIFNQEVSKEYFEEFTKDITQKVNTPGFLKEIKDFLSNRIVKQYRLYNSQDCIGDDLINCNKCYLCFLMLSSENCKYAYESGWFSKYIVDGMEAGDFSEYLYESMMAHKNYKCGFFINSNSCKDSYYCKDCFNSSDLFGCVGLKHKQYCILNKQYTKEEYEVLVPKIIEYMQKTGERGEFFSASISPFGYNETVANEDYLLSRDESIARGYKRMDKEYPINVPEGIELVRAQDLSDNIHDIPDEILKKAIVCEVSGKPFRIVKPELDFYRKHNLSLPRKHPDVRHLERLSKRAPRNLYLRTCDNCGKQVISVYPADSEFKVYCEECYNKQVY